MTTEQQRIRSSEMQLCVACNKLVRLDVSSCKCGHVLREALTLKEDQTSSGRKRRATYRPNSVSLEWISIQEKSELKMALKKSKLENLNNIQKQTPNSEHIKNDNNNNNSTIIHSTSKNINNNYTNNKSPRPVGRPKQNKYRHGNFGRKKFVKLNSTTSAAVSNTYCAENVAPPSTGEAIPSQQQQNQNEKQNKLKEMATAMLESASYQNIYFHRCKSYKKATKLSDLDFEFDFSMFDSHHPYYPSALEDINTKINKTNSFWKSIL